MRAEGRRALFRSAFSLTIWEKHATITHPAPSVAPSVTAPLTTSQQTVPFSCDFKTTNIKDLKDKVNHFETWPYSFTHKRRSTKPLSSNEARKPSRLRNLLKRTTLTKAESCAACDGVTQPASVPNTSLPECPLDTPESAR